MTRTDDVTQIVSTHAPDTRSASHEWPPPDVVSRCWPGETARLVLHAALAQPDLARHAWDQVRHSIDLSPVARSELHRLLPMIALNLGRADDDHPDLPILGLIHHATTLRNAELVQLSSTWLREMADAGVRACLTKGLPLALLDYDDTGSRPMSDVDVVVSIEQLPEAMAALERAGWTTRMTPDRIPQKLRLTHAAGFAHPDGGHVDLHWYVNKFLVHPEQPWTASRTFLDRARPLDVAGVEAFALDRTDSLALAVLHGAWRGSGATVRWVPDAVILARRLSDGGGPDGDRLVWIGRHFGVGLMMHESLRYLVEEFDAPIPESVLDSLATIRPSRRQMMRYRAATNDGRAPEPLAAIPLWRAFWAQDRWGRTDLEALGLLPTFLSSVLGLRAIRRDPSLLLERARRMISTVGAALRNP